MSRLAFAILTMTLVSCGAGGGGAVLQWCEAVQHQGEVALAMLAAPEGSDQRAQLFAENNVRLDELFRLKAPGEIAEAWALAADVSATFHPQYNDAVNDVREYLESECSSVTRDVTDMYRHLDPAPPEA